MCEVHFMLVWNMEHGTCLPTFSIEKKKRVIGRAIHIFVAYIRKTSLSNKRTNIDKCCALSVLFCMCRWCLARPSCDSFGVFVFAAFVIHLDRIYTLWWYWCHVSRWDCNFCLTIMLNETVQQISLCALCRQRFLFSVWWITEYVEKIGVNIYRYTYTSQKGFSWIDITVQPQTVINRWRKCTWNVWLWIISSVSTTDLV